MDRVVVDLANPRTQDLLQLADVVERPRLDVLAAGEHVRTLVPGQVLQQRLPHRAEEPLHRRLVRRLVRDRRLNADPQPGTRPDHMRRQVLPAVIHHDRLRQRRRTTRHPLLMHPVRHLRTDQHIRRHAMERPRPPGYLLRTHTLVQNACHVRRLRRHRGHPQPQHAAREQIQRHGQLHRHPPARHRLHREHVQRRGVQHHELPRTIRPQPAQHPLRPPRHRPAALRRPERIPALPQHLQPPIRRRPVRDGHDVGAESHCHLPINFVNHRTPGRRRRVRERTKNRQTNLIPTRVDPRGPGLEFS